MVGAIHTMLVVLLLGAAVPTGAPPAPRPAATVALAANGEAKATVVISPDAPPGVQLAAQELAQFVARMAGCPAALPVKALGEPPATPEPSYVFVGAVGWALSETSFDAAAMPAEGYCT